MAFELDTKKLDGLIAQYGSDQSALIQVLQDVQKEYNYLPREAMAYLSERLGVPLAHTYNVATFYNAFSLTPKGAHTCTVCMGTACHILGGKRVLDFMLDELGIEEGGTTEDGEYTVERVNCLGACALGPIVVMDGEYHSHISIDKARKLIRKGKQS